MGVVRHVAPIMYATDAGHDDHQSEGGWDNDASE